MIVCKFDLTFHNNKLYFFKEKNVLSMFTNNPHTKNFPQLFKLEIDDKAAKIPILNYHGHQPQKLANLPDHRYSDSSHLVVCTL